MKRDEQWGVQDDATHDMWGSGPRGGWMAESWQLETGLASAVDGIGGGW